MEAIKRVDLFDVVERRADSCVNCKDFIVNNSTEREAITCRHKIIPNTLIVVVSHALLIKAEPLLQGKRTYTNATENGFRDSLEEGRFVQDNGSLRKIEAQLSRSTSN